MPLIWISNTNKSHLFGFVWEPPCCERKVGGTGQRILELLSENIDGLEPVPILLKPKTHDSVLQVRLHPGNTFNLFLFILKESWLSSKSTAVLCTALSTPGVFTFTEKATKTSHLASELLWLKDWRLRLNAMLVMIYETFLIQIFLLALEMFFTTCCCFKSNNYTHWADWVVHCTRCIHSQTAFMQEWTNAHPITKQQLTVVKAC